MFEIFRTVFLSNYNVGTDCEGGGLRVKPQGNHKRFTHEALVQCTLNYTVPCRGANDLFSLQKYEVRPFITYPILANLEN